MEEGGIMKTTTTNWIGAKWWKFDFHTHTPASEDFGKGANQEELKKITPKNWLLNFMKADVDCVAVTDHNSGEWIDKLKSAYEELRNENHEDFRELYLFPGVEISVGEIHILAILDPSKKSSDISKLLGGVDFNADSNIAQKSILETIKIISNQEGIAIPAHVDMTKGLLYELNGQNLLNILNLEDLNSLEVVDIENLKQGPKEEEKLGNKIASIKKSFSNVLGSDSHHPTGTETQSYPGKSFTWIKMGTPSLDGLKLALLDGELSIKRSDTKLGNPNEHSVNYIESIILEEAKYIGRTKDNKPNPVEIKLNPWMNSFIGGRGTGKSSFVEFVRLIMRRQDEIPYLLKEEFRKYNEVPKNRSENGLLTSEAKFSLIYNKENTRYKINWEYSNNQNNPIESWNGNEWIKEEGNINERFPISIYSQKQIYSFADNPKYLLDKISSQRKIGFQEWKQTKEELENRFYSCKNKLRELNLTLEKEANWKGELSDISKKIVLLEEKGFKDILTKFQKRQKQSGYLKSWEGNISSLPERILSIEEDLIPLSLPDDIINQEDEADLELTKIVKSVNIEIEKRKSEFSKQAKLLLETLEKWTEEKGKSQWEASFSESEERYTQILKELATNTSNAQEEYGKLFQIKQDLESKLQKIESTKQECIKLNTDIASILNELLKHRKLLSEKRQGFLDEVFQSNDLVRINILPFGNKQDVESELRTLLNMETSFESIIGHSESEEGFVFDLYSDSIDEQKIFDLKQKIKGLSEGINFEATGQYKKFKDRIVNLPQSNFDQLDLYFPEDSLKIEYKNTKGQYLSITQGSPGQKTAALLSFVLSYGNDPLILDQPEDDLDNRLIYELIVKQLKESKSKRQIIVVTHNANIVVNGDSELIYCLESENGQTNIEKHGCLQDKNIREEICSILEGGKDAFQLRYKRIEPYA